MNLQSEREQAWTRVAPQLQSVGSIDRCHWLPGDASNRFYARLEDSKAKKSYILMVMNAPEAFKSEEVTGSDESKLKELPFVVIGRELERHQLRVPHIHWIDPKAQFILLEDLGDELLYDRRQKESSLPLYKKALEQLARLQKLEAFEPVKSRSFTKELLYWEFEHFLEWGIEKNAKVLTPNQKEELVQFFKRSTEKIAQMPLKFTHRDYHSKNLMIVPKTEEIGIIDFQDALMGPDTYDLASLLRDSYVSFSDEEEKELLQYYEALTKTKLSMQNFGLMSLQRNMKAAGRFVYISKVKGRDTHLPYVGPTLQRIVRTLKQLQELKVLSLIEGLFQNELRS